MSATVILDSISEYEDRITTFELEFPRFILAELNTHRGFSRNSASSRAVPTKKLLERTESSPFIPTMGYNKPGMSSIAELNAVDMTAAQATWRKASLQMIDAARFLDMIGVHKQWTNRLLEPFLMHRVLLTTTTDALVNFWNQRLGEGAQPEMHTLAKEIWDVYCDSEPVERMIHIPYYPTDELFNPERSVACCARVSYDNFDGPSDLKKDLGLFTKLLGADPPHWSPFEHQATAIIGRHANYDGWRSWRTHLEGFDDKEVTTYLQWVYEQAELV